MNCRTEVKRHFCMAMPVICHLILGSLAVCLPPTWYVIYIHPTSSLTGFLTWCHVVGSSFSLLLTCSQHRLRQKWVDNVVISLLNFRDFHNIWTHIVDVIVHCPVVCKVGCYSWNVEFKKHLIVSAPERLRLLPNNLSCEWVYSFLAWWKEGGKQASKAKAVGLAYSEPVWIQYLLLCMFMWPILSHLRRV